MSVNLESSPTCQYDYLQVFNGGYGDSPLIGTYCTSTPPDFLSQSNSVRLVFLTDAAVGGGGFKVTYSFETNGKNLHLNNCHALMIDTLHLYLWLVMYYRCMHAYEHKNVTYKGCVCVSAVRYSPKASLPAPPSSLINDQSLTSHRISVACESNLIGHLCLVLCH